VDPNNSVQEQPRNSSAGYKLKIWMLESISSQLEGGRGTTEEVKKVSFVETSHAVHSVMHVIILRSYALRCDHN